MSILYIIFFFSQAVMMEICVWLMGTPISMAVWKFATTIPGVLSVMTSTMYLMLM